MACVAWKDVCAPKSMGDLGTRRAEHFNNASLTKLAWKVISDKDKWWLQIVSKNT